MLKIIFYFLGSLAISSCLMAMNEQSNKQMEFLEKLFRPCSMLERGILKPSNNKLRKLIDATHADNYRDDNLPFIRKLLCKCVNSKQEFVIHAKAQEEFSEIATLNSIRQNLGYVMLRYAIQQGNINLVKLLGSTVNLNNGLKALIMDKELFTDPQEYQKKHSLSPVLDDAIKTSELMTKTVLDLGISPLELEESKRNCGNAPGCKYYIEMLNKCGL